MFNCFVSFTFYVLISVLQIFKKSNTLLYHLNSQLRPVTFFRINPKIVRLKFAEYPSKMYLFTCHWFKIQTSHAGVNHNKIFDPPQCGFIISVVSFEGRKNSSVKKRRPRCRSGFRTSAPHRNRRWYPQHGHRSLPSESKILQMTRIPVWPTSSLIS